MSEQPGQPTTRLPYFPGLDGLRALAVIAVLLYHAGLQLRGGFLGVESFFVISGYLITALLLHEWQTHGTISLRAFWLRRARRLLPALFLLLIGTFLATAVLVPRQLVQVRNDAIAALAYVMNWYLVWQQQPYFDPTVRPPLLQHLWSLAVEEQFYLLWPLLFIVGMRRLRAAGLLFMTLIVAAASVVLMLLWRERGVDITRIYYGTDTRAAGLLIGVALALVWSPGKPPASEQRSLGLVLECAGGLALVALLWSYGSFFDRHPLLYRGGFALVGLLTATVIMAVTHPQVIVLSRLLGTQPLRWIGLRSYGIYLWHWPVFLFTRPYLDVPFGGLPLLVVRMTLAVGLAALSYHFVELPIRQGAIERWWQARNSGDSATLPRIDLRRLGWLSVPLVPLILITGMLWSTRSVASPSGEGSRQRPTVVAIASARNTPVATRVLPSPTTVMATVVRATLVPTKVASTSTVERAVTDPITATTIPPTATPDPPTATAEVLPTPTTRNEVVTVRAEPAELDPVLIAELQRLLDETVVDQFVPGAVVSVSIPGYLPWSGASGSADFARDLPMEPDTLVHLASLTKMYTAVIILQLVEEGKLDLDAPIGTWLPEIVLFADRTTIRHLLQQTSGIYDYLEDPQFFGAAYGNPRRIWTPTELIAAVDYYGPAFQPGEEWDYSSTNYIILGQLVEQVTGQPLAVEMRQRIFEPLGLSRTFFAPDEEVDAVVAHGYIGNSANSEVSMTFVWGTGNLISTASDLRRFVEALWGEELLQPASQAQMRAMIDTGGAYAIPELRYGLGLMDARLNVGPGPDGQERPEALSAVQGHIGGIAGFRSAAWRVPESGITMALSLNQAEIDPNLLARDVLDAILTWQGR